MDGRPVGTGRVVALRERPEQDRRHLLLVEVPAADKLRVAGFTIREPSEPVDDWEYDESADDPIVCRCERVRKSTIVAEIRQGVRDVNQLKALARVSMGGCGGKTCTELVRRIFREEGIELGEVTPGTIRPLVAEAPLGMFVMGEEKGDG
jgi:bacterioferritin-associated ferredoxin